MSLSLNYTLMEGFTEKKWFVYLGDHHEGPFSLDEIQGKLSNGQVSTTQYVWCDGMSDWKLMTEVDAFETIRNAIPVPPPTLGAGATLDRTESRKIHLTAIRGGGEENAAPSEAAPALPTSAPATGAQELLKMAPAPVAVTTKKVTAVTPTSPAQARKRRLSRGFMAVLVLLLIALGGGFALMNGQADWLAKQPWLLKLPGVGSLLSPIPLLDDVASEDFEELRLAASQPAANRTALVLSQTDPFAPIFYAAANAPDGTELELKLEGVPETLLNETEANFTAKQTLQKKFAKFDPIRGADGKSVPRGQYKVSVLNGGQALATKSFFLGGVKDATYLARLKEFHDKLWEKATAEITELKQFAMTLDEQLQITIKNFAETNRKYFRGNPGAKRMWGELDAKWNGLQAQLAATFNKWTPESLKTDYFYGDLRAQLQALGQQVAALHLLQSNFYLSKEAAAENEPKIVIAMQATQAFAQKLGKAIDDLNALVTAHATALPPKPAPL